MSTLAVDIGVARFRLAMFDGDRIVERVSGATDRAAGRDWMLGKIAGIIADWKTRHAIDRGGVGFGGPVDFENQRVALSTHVSGWSDYDLPRYLEHLIGVPPIMDNDANWGALGEALYGAGRASPPLFYIPLSPDTAG